MAGKSLAARTRDAMSRATKKVTKRGATGAETTTPARKENGARKKTGTKTAKKTVVTKSPKAVPAKKTVVKKTPVKKTPAKKTPAKKTPAKKTPAKKTPAKKTPAKKTTAKPAPETKGATSGKAERQRPIEATVLPGPHARPRVAAPTVIHTDGANALAVSVPATGLATKRDEQPWSAAELAHIREQLSEELENLSLELAAMRSELRDLLAEVADGAGDDDADTGNKAYEREREMALMANAVEMREQVEHALALVDTGEYGLCERCEQPIGKVRLQAFPRATLCLSCKQRQERR